MICSEMKKWILTRVAPAASCTFFVSRYFDVLRLQIIQIISLLVDILQQANVKNDGAPILYQIGKPKHIKKKQIP